MDAGQAADIILLRQRGCRGQREKITDCGSEGWQGLAAATITKGGEAQRVICPHIQRH